MNIQQANKQTAEEVGFWRQIFSRTIFADVIVVIDAARSATFRLDKPSRNSLWKMKFFDDTSGPVPGGEVDLDVDEDHDAAGDVERSEGRVQDVPDVFAQLKMKINKSG